jgi:hypothetical protein
VIQIEFTSEEVDALELERYHHPDPKVQKKMEALYLKSQQLAHQDICRLCRISEPTLVAYLKPYQEGGIDQLKKTGIPAQVAHWTHTLRRWKAISKTIRRAR